MKPRRSYEPGIAHAGEPPLDLGACCTRCGHDTSTTLIMLRRFEAQLQADVPRIWRAISQNHTEEALSLTRTVKAAATHACAEPTRDAASTVERALTRSDMESAIVAAGELRAEADRFQAYMPTVQATLSGHHDDGLRQRSHTDNNE